MSISTTDPEASAAAAMLGKKGKGKPKRFSPEDISRLRARMVEMNARRAAKKAAARKETDET